MDLLITLFGSEDQVEGLQMAARAVVVFALTLMAVRIAGRRSFGQRTPFDQVVTILLGAVASRAVVGASPFWATMGACLVIVCLHRLIAHLSMRFAGIDELLNGTERVVVCDGKTVLDEMNKALLTARDLHESVRLKGVDKPNEVKLMVLERNGEISVLRKDS